MTFLIDLGSKNGSQIHPQIKKKKYIPEAIHKPYQKKNNRKVMFPDSPEP